jgi:hypothetical protein
VGDHDGGGSNRVVDHMRGADLDRYVAAEHATVAAHGIDEQ